ncbi:hypothetical protein BGW38_005510 [Lunasporangiospora selenospora]|uniref:Uncharacterized protein n=1 Tax=Lunasporangiospora selenospora TaxID=979761 RepID=A0A9P6G086_9FUNG|nr:hypothetical protein BGW38_005510 [Lunasporangiospora selenospora]
MSTSWQPSQHNNLPVKKHAKKKQRSSWKAGSKSIPSSPLLVSQEEQRSSVLQEITPRSNNASPATCDNADCSCRQTQPSTTALLNTTPEPSSAQKTFLKENSLHPTRANKPKDWSISQRQPIQAEGSLPPDSKRENRQLLQKNDTFLDSLDAQLIKLQQGESNDQPQGAPSTIDGKDTRLQVMNGISRSEEAVDREIPPPQPSIATGTPANERLYAVSLWDYLKEELTAADFESTQELKRERVVNFLSVPVAFEKMLVFGYFVCLDSFLYTFTILPARFLLALAALGRYLLSRTWFSRSPERIRLKSSQKCDLIKVTLVAVSCTILHSVDASRMYHFIRGQNAMKLYAIFNCLEIFDRLCCSFGQDILDSLFSKATLGNHPPKSGMTPVRHARPITFIILAIFYMLAHTMVLFFQMVTLNVAVNSYSNALLTLLISNQFVEIKGSVFKKFEKENLFQLSCSDIVERFQLSVFVAIITVRNLVELSASPPSPFSIYPQSFVPLFSSMTTVARLLMPCFLVLGCETLVDWLKHAFITKFNQIRPSVYGRFVDILSKDLVFGSPARIAGRTHQNMFVDQSPMVSRRIGLAALPLGCLVICVTIQTLQMVFSTGSMDISNANISGAETLVVPIVDHISLDWDMPYVDFSSGINVATAGMVEVLISLLRFFWVVLGYGSTLLCRAMVDQVGLPHELGRRVIEYTVIAIAILATYACLVALKLLIGINLLGYSHHRAAVSGMLDGRSAGLTNSDTYLAGGEKRGPRDIMAEVLREKRRNMELCSTGES